MIIIKNITKRKGELTVLVRMRTMYVKLHTEYEQSKQEQANRRLYLYDIMIFRIT